MRLARVCAAAAASVLLIACRAEEGPPPPPFALTSEATGNFCGMNLMEHAGPKGQIILADRAKPIWFSSARDAIAYTMLPGERRRIRAIYVSDMGKAQDWDQPGTMNWTDARKAFYVLGSAARSGMGSDEAVPFGARAEADAFAQKKGGRVVSFADVPEAYVLGQTEDETMKGEAGSEAPAGARR